MKPLDRVVTSTNLEMYPLDASYEGQNDNGDPRFSQILLAGASRELALSHLKLLIPWCQVWYRLYHGRPILCPWVDAIDIQGDIYTRDMTIAP